MILSTLALNWQAGLASASDVDPFGRIDATPGLITYGEDIKTGPVAFVNAVISFFAAVAGIWLLITIIISGIKIIHSAKDPASFSENMQKILWSTIGLVIVAFAWIIAGWVSYLLFGSSNFILNPILQIPDQQLPPS